MGAARVCSVAVTLIGIGLVPLFDQFESIYEAHGAMTAAVTPPLVVTLLCSVFWRRFTAPAALCTLAGGMLAIVVSMFCPRIIAPFAHGVPPGDIAEGLLGGVNAYKYMRAFYGLSVSAVIAVAVTFLTKAEPFARCRGLVWGTVKDALAAYKGSPGSETRGLRAEAAARKRDGEEQYTGIAQLPVVNVSQALAQRLEAGVGDLVYLSDRRRWLGGLRSAHAVIGEVVGDAETSFVEMGIIPYRTVVAPHRKDQPIIVECLYGRDDV
jgi:SSS family solute:Na+ symporter